MDIPETETLQGRYFAIRMSFAEQSDKAALQDIKQILFGEEKPAADLRKDLTYEKI